MSYILGFDIGTTASKAILTDYSGRIYAEFIRHHDIQIRHPLWQEENMSLWWDEFCQAIAYFNSIDSLVLTHLDIYDEMESIEACIAYDIGGKIITDFPAGIPALNAARPVLKKFDGWKSDLRSCASYEKMPANAKTYVEFIESFTETPVGIVSVGADRNDTYLRIHPWAK